MCVCAVCSNALCVVMQTELIDRMVSVEFMVTFCLRFCVRTTHLKNCLLLELQLLEDKLKRGLISTGQYGGDDDSGRETDENTDATKTNETFNDNVNVNILDLSLKVTHNGKFNLLEKKTAEKNEFCLKQLDELQIPGLISTNRSSRPQSAMTDTNRPSSVHERERPTPYPTCYTSLLAGRATGISLSVSPGQNVQPGKL